RRRRRSAPRHPHRRAGDDSDRLGEDRRRRLLVRVPAPGRRRLPGERNGGRAGDPGALGGEERARPLKGGAPEVTPRDPSAERLASISDRIVAAQRPIRILQAITWPDAVRARFLDREARELPEFEYPPLAFDAA